ncbi:hypothetical protein PPERSA_12536 [Pseudocohnilembus persalinus]|uniref:Uncharacterized protein n=1 Tax=Pseudocohnilembus persalinus TaxID=266149 RepID=A0A0V0QB44_PSEPJ|nr:hypothetical protein PPERSA_12536 [Pseudocohnilembus persalinus]|eukprot:KRW99432.1 hypothetical protein PPERSA_12536 [Pseudocohnilembus persalinus]
MGEKKIFQSFVDLDRYSSMITQKEVSQHYDNLKNNNNNFENNIIYNTNKEQDNINNQNNNDQITEQQLSNQKKWEVQNILESKFYVMVPNEENLNVYFIEPAKKFVLELDNMAYKIESIILEEFQNNQDFERDRIFSMLNGLLYSSYEQVYIKSILQIVEFLENYQSVFPLPEINLDIAKEMQYEIFQKRNELKVKFKLPIDEFQHLASDIQESQLSEKQNQQKQEFLQKMDQRGSVFLNIPLQIVQQSKFYQSNVMVTDESFDDLIQEKIIYSDLDENQFKNNIDNKQLINQICHFIVDSFMKKQTPVNLFYHYSYPNAENQLSSLNILNYILIKPRFQLQLIKNPEYTKQKKTNKSRQEIRYDFRKAIYDHYMVKTDFTDILNEVTKENQKQKVNSPDKSQRNSTNKIEKNYFSDHLIKEGHIIDPELIKYCYFKYDIDIQLLKTKILDIFKQMLDQFKNLSKIGIYIDMCKSLE